MRVRSRRPKRRLADKARQRRETRSRVTGTGRRRGTALFWPGIAADEVGPVARGIGKRPVAAGRSASSGAFTIEPGRPERSILVHRLGSTGPGVARPEPRPCDDAPRGAGIDRTVDRRDACNRLARETRGALTGSPAQKETSMATAQIYRDLKADHDRQRAMLKELGELRGDAGKRQRLFETFRLELQSHAAAEEEALYSVMLGDPELREDARHSVAEHKEVDDLLGEMMDLDFGSAEWEEKFSHMRHRYEHHIEEEEEDMFPAADARLDDATEEKIAATYEERKPQELELARDNPPGGDERD